MSVPLLTLRKSQGAAMMEMVIHIEEHFVPYETLKGVLLVRKNDPATHISLLINDGQWNER